MPSRRPSAGNGNTSTVLYKSSDTELQVSSSINCLISARRRSWVGVIRDMGERRPSPRRTWKENHLFVVFGSSSPCNGLRKSAWIFCIIPLTDRRPTIIKYTDAGESNSLWQKQYSNCTLSAWGNSSTFLHPYLLASSLMCLVNIWQQLLACQISLAWRQDEGKQLPWVLPEGVGSALPVQVRHSLIDTCCQFNKNQKYKKCVFFRELSGRFVSRWTEPGEVFPHVFMLS